MRRPYARWYIWLAPVVALVVGYATGHAPGAATNATLTVPGSSLALEYPSDWRPAKPPAALSAFGLKRAVLLAPKGEPGGGGLIAAAVSDEGDPLPQGVLARMVGGFEGEAISLVGAPAFRYEHLSVAGSGLGLTVYSIPTSLDRFTLAICFGPRTRRSTRSACEEIVESQTLDEGSTVPLELKPGTAYASQLGAALTGLTRTQGKVRAAMATAATASELAQEARQLADALAGTDATLKSLSPPPIAVHAATAVERAVLRGQLAYEALASDAVRGARSRFAQARHQISEAETGMHQAIESFALLGYHVS